MAGSDCREGPTVRDPDLGHGDVLKWVADRLLFDLSEYREWVGSIHLLAPNPVFRQLNLYRERTRTGDEATVVRMIARAGQSLDGLQIVLSLFGPTGIARATVFNVSGPALRVPHVGSVDLVSHQVVCPRRGVLDWSKPEPYINLVTLEMNPVVETWKVQVPDEPKPPGETYEVRRTGGAMVTRAGSPPSQTPMRVVRMAQEARRLREAADERVEKWFHGEGTRDSAGKFVRDLIGSARSRVWIIDPYLATVEVYRFVLSVTRDSVDVTVVTSAKHLKGKDRAFANRKAGRVLLEEIARLRPRVRIAAYVMTGQ